MKDILKIIFVIIGAFIGAGFSSGQEMYLFFFKYGKHGLLGLVVSTVLIGVIIYKIFKIIKSENVGTYYEFLEKITNLKKGNKSKILVIANETINMLLLITFFIMIAGFGAYFKQEIGISSLVGSIILVVICFTIFLTNVDGMIKANEYLVPILIFFIVVIGILNIKTIDFLNLNNYFIKTNETSWIVKSILYASYNIILIVPVLITLKKLIKNNRQIKIIAVITSLIILILALFIFLELIKVDVNIEELEMPVVYVIRNCYPIFKQIYAIVILGSIFTTAISIGISFLKNTTKTKKSYTQTALIMCITGIAISQLGFSNLVKILYPIFGILGIAQIILIFKTKT